MVGIITGREPLSAFDAFVNDWRSRGGDQMRKEFEPELKGSLISHPPVRVRVA